MTLLGWGGGKEGDARQAHASQRWAEKRLDPKAFTMVERPKCYESSLDSGLFLHARQIRLVWRLLDELDFFRGHDPVLRVRRSA